MTRRVAIIGIGSTGFRPVTPDLSYRELIFKAAVKAYQEAGLHPQEIDTFISATEDFIEGYSIADEYIPDQLGAVLKPVQTVCADYLQAIGVGYMLINTGRFNTVAVEAHSKVSNIKTLDDVKAFAMDPVHHRPLKENADLLAGLEMRRFLAETGNTEEQCAMVSVKNHKNALYNSDAGYAAVYSVEDVLNSEPIATPLKLLDKAQTSDGCVVCVLASEEVAKSICKNPIWINGVSWFSVEADICGRDLSQAEYAKLAANRAYEMAGIKHPASEIDFAEICDEYSYKELQHLEALGLARKGQSGAMTAEGATSIEGPMPVNLSGGSLGVGHTFEASGGMKLYEAVLQLRHQAGERQVKNARTGLVQAWRGTPTGTGVVAVLSNE